jgi:tetratricopeptide (TPR) repeat protein
MPRPTFESPFDLAPMDDDVQADALATALTVSHGFALLFAVCENPTHRDRLIAAVQERLAGRSVQTLEVARPTDNLYRYIQSTMASPSPDALFVIGLETWIHAADDASRVPFILNLNAARTHFAARMPCPLVLWVPSYVLVLIARGAPDFISVRSGTYFFADVAAGSRDRDAPTVVDQSRVHEHLRSTREERLREQESILAGYRSLPERDFGAESRLMLSIGTILESLEKYAEAESMYTDALVASRTLGDLQAEAEALHDLGNVRRNQGRWSAAKEAYLESLKIRHTVGDSQGEESVRNNLGLIYLDEGRWTEAEAAFEQILSSRQAFGDRHGEGLTLNNLGLVYQHQGRWSEAEATYQRSLDVIRAFGDRGAEARVLNNLGIVYQNQDRWSDAESKYLQSLTIKRSLGDPHGEAQTLNNLGIVYQHQGRWSDGEATHRQSLAIFRAFGDRHGEAQVLGNLGSTYRSLGRLDDAEAAYRQSVAVFLELGDRHGEGQALSNLATLYRRRGLWKDAEVAYQQDLAICRALGDRQGEGMTLGQIALLKYEEAGPADAIPWAQQAVAALDETEGVALRATIQEWIAKWEAEVAARAVSTPDT